MTPRAGSRSRPTNNEDFGPDSLLGRGSDREVVLTRPLREKLKELNPGLPDAALKYGIANSITQAAQREET